MNTNTNTTTTTPSTTNRFAAGVRRFAVVLGVMLGLFAALGQNAGAEYKWFDDDFIRGGTTQAQFAGNWSGNSALVRWWEDGSIVRGEVKARSVVQVKPGANPKCIAVRLRWKRITGTASFSVPASAGVSVGVTETSDGYTISCRGNSGVARPISMAGAALSGRSVLGLNLDVCHKATPTSVWACATDANSAGGE